MTTTTPATAPAAIVAGNQGVLMHLDPNSIILEQNVRQQLPDSDQLIASVKEHGVITPVLARRDDKGNVLVRGGQRRTLAARQAGLATMPVYIVEADENTAERVIQQIIENEQRTELTESDRVAAYQQLAFENIPVATIARRIGATKAQVVNGLAAAENQAATAVLATQPVTIEQSLVLAEFKDNKQISDRLLATALNNPAQFAHETQNARDSRERAASVKKTTAELKKAGWAILTGNQCGYYGEYSTIKGLVKADGTEVTAADIKGIEGSGVHIEAGHTGTEARVTYWIIKPRKHGFRDQHSNAPAGPMTDEQKAERKTVVANNRQWGSAETVRREFVATLLSRKTLPKNAALFTATALTSFQYEISRSLSQGNPRAQALLGLDKSRGGRSNSLAQLLAATPTKAGYVSLAIVLGGIEDSLDRGSWRLPAKEVAAYLAQLVEWGYTLSPVEQIILNKFPTKPAAK